MGFADVVQDVVESVEDANPVKEIASGPDPVRCGLDVFSNF